MSILNLKATPPAPARYHVSTTLILDGLVRTFRDHGKGYSLDTLRGSLPCSHHGSRRRHVPDRG